MIAERTTFDGVRVCIWSNGDLTGAMGIYPKGVGKTFGASQIRVARLIQDEISMYDWAELADLIKVARKAIQQPLVPAITYVRRAMAGETFRAVTKAVVVARPRRHAAFCPCADCNPGRVLPPGTIAGAPRYR